MHLPNCIFYLLPWFCSIKVNDKKIAMQCGRKIHAETRYVNTPLETFFCKKNRKKSLTSHIQQSIQDNELIKE